MCNLNVEHSFSVWIRAESKGPQGHKATQSQCSLQWMGPAWDGVWQTLGETVETQKAPKSHLAWDLLPLIHLFIKTCWIQGIVISSYTSFSKLMAITSSKFLCKSHTLGLSFGCQGEYSLTLVQFGSNQSYTVILYLPLKITPRFHWWVSLSPNGQISEELGNTVLGGHWWPRVSKMELTRWHCLLALGSGRCQSWNKVNTEGRTLMKIQILGDLGERWGLR